AEGALAGLAADQDGAVVVEADDARDQRDAVLVADDDRAAVLRVRGETEGGAQVDADDVRGTHVTGGPTNRMGDEGFEPPTLRCKRSVMPFHQSPESVCPEVA